MDRVVYGEVWRVTLRDGSTTLVCVPPGSDPKTVIFGACWRWLGAREMPKEKPFKSIEFVDDAMVYIAKFKDPR